MAHPRRAVYDQALLQTQKSRMPSFHVDKISRAVALGYPGRTEESGIVVAVLLQPETDFEESGQEAIQHIWRYA